jgi:hypothetical protein
MNRAGLYKAFPALLGDAPSGLGTCCEVLDLGGRAWTDRCWARSGPSVQLRDAPGTSAYKVAELNFAAFTRVWLRRVAGELRATSGLSLPVDAGPVDLDERLGDAVLAPVVLDSLTAAGDGPKVVDDQVAADGKLRI